MRTKDKVEAVMGVVFILISFVMTVLVFSGLTING